MPFTPEQFVILAIVLIAGFGLGFASRPSPRKWRVRAQRQAQRFAAYHDDAEDRLRAAQQRGRSLEAEAAALRADREEAGCTIAGLRGAPPVPGEPATDATTPDRAVRPALALVPLPEPEPLVRHDAASISAPPMPVAQSAARPAFGIAPHGPAAPQAATADRPLPMTPTPSAGAPAPIGPAAPDLPAADRPDARSGNGPGDDLTRIRGIDGALATRLSALGVLRFEDVATFSAEDEMALEQRLALPVGFVAREKWRMLAALLRAGRHDDHAAGFGTLEAPAQA